MAGGSGERFWPLSRKALPKHLLKFFSPQSLLGDAVTRAYRLTSPPSVCVLTSSIQVQPTREALVPIGVCEVFAEPCRRDTAAAASLATAIAARKDPSGSVVLLPADHLIRDVDSFHHQLSDAVDLAQGREALVTVSIPPTWASTAFGYLEKGALLASGTRGSRCYEVSKFVEKPDKEKAEKYLASGHFAWNAGMFVWTVGTFLKEARKWMPPLADFIEGYASASDPGEFLQRKFPELPKTSVDYGIMEKAERVVTVEAKFDWDDVGSWTAMQKYFSPDEQGNSVTGKAVFHDAEQNIVVSTGRVIALCGVKDLVVVETPDAVLVCHRDAAEKIRHLQPKLPSEVL